MTAAAIIALLACSAFFSGSETALTAVSRARMRRRASQGDERAKRVMALTEDGERLIGSILLGNNVVNILSTSLATSVIVATLGDSGVAVATLLMTVLVLIFAEVLPKTYAYAYAEKTAERVARPVALIVRLLSPLVGAVRWIVRGSLHVFGIQLDKDAKVLSREADEEIRGAIDMHHSEGAVIKHDRDMLMAALDLKSRDVSEVMMHRRHIVTLDADAPPAEILTQAIASPYTRIPIWREEPENIVGVLHAKDLLRAVGDLISAGGSIDTLDIHDVAMEPWFIPDTTSLAEQLKAFLTVHSHFALVVDEYGALQGLITLEDILEEIVGEIADEHDDEAAGVTPEADGSYLVDGASTIRDLNRHFDWKLPDDEATTIAGLVIHEAQMIPEARQTFIFHGFRFEIVERKRNQITKIRMRLVRR